MYSIHLGVVKRLVYLFWRRKKGTAKKVEDIFGVKYVLNKASFIKRGQKEGMRCTQKIKKQ